MTPEEEEAARLLRAAESDRRALEALAADADQSDDVVGFHAQQAVEKALKAVLAGIGAEVPYTHDLGFLSEVLGANGVKLPPSVEVSAWLTPWAVAARYGAADAKLDRLAATELTRTALEWAEGRLGHSGS